MKALIIFFLLFGLLFSAPSYAARKDKEILDQMQTVLDIVLRLEEKITIIAGESSTMAKQIKLIEEKVNAISNSSADSSQDKESLKLSLQFIKEEINELKNSINRVNDRLINMPSSPSTTPVEEETPGESKTEAPAQSAEIIYYTAYSDYIKKNYPLAIEGFKQLLSAFPDNALADNSLYWIGECYYSQKNYPEAVNTFTRLIAKYADGDKIPDAILKKGYALIEMGKQSEGVETLKELISRFPLSEEASLAQQKIKDVME